jgi:hypothetical protein
MTWLLYIAIGTVITTMVGFTGLFIYVNLKTVQLRRVARKSQPDFADHLFGPRGKFLYFYSPTRFLIVWSAATTERCKEDAEFGNALREARKAWEYLLISMPLLILLNLGVFTLLIKTENSRVASKSAEQIIQPGGG